MATYATIRHVELDRIGHGKKRVLKPPGGGSSISFGDDPLPVRKISQPAAPKPVDNGNDAAPPKQEAEKEALVSSEEVAKKEENGSPAKEEVAAEETPKAALEEVKEAQAEVATTNGTTNGVETATPSKVDETPSSPAVDTSIPPPVEKLSLNGNTPDESKNTPEPKVENHNSESIKSPKANLPPLKISNGQQAPSQNSPSSASNGHSSPKGDLTPNRKIKDHMRSNIFNPTVEDYTPTRSSRATAQVVTPEANVTSNAGQRGRVPPGGFSTKLW